MWAVKGKTEKIRHRLVYNVAKIVAPKFYWEIKENQEFIQRTPRPFTLFLKQHFNNTPLVGVEIGFGLGENAESLLENLNMKKLFCVDPGIGQPYIDLHGEVRCHVGKYNRYSTLKDDSRVEFVKLSSDDALHVLPHDVDFVYVDGLHTYEQCLKDLVNYHQLIREGGFLGGHDFTKLCQEGVIKAVLEYSVKSGIVPTVVIPDFWFSVNLQKTNT